MDLEELSDIETKSCMLLCKKCLKKGEYNIPLFELNEINVIEYKCIKRHIIDKKDISYQPVNEKIKKKLTVCNNKGHFDVHQGQLSVFFAFCEICEKNICQFGVGDDLRRDHNYILYKDIMSEYKYKNDLEQKLEILKQIINIYKDIYAGEKDEIYNLLFKNIKYFIYK